MTLACARQWQTTAPVQGGWSKLHECERAANHKAECVCTCGAVLESCARLPSSGTGPGEVPTRKPSEILADRGTRQRNGMVHYLECPEATGAPGACCCGELARP